MSDDRLQRELPCVNCAYDLRGLATDGPCPECGKPIAATWNRDLLRFADIAQLRRLVRSMELLSTSAKVPFLTMAAEFVLWPALLQVMNPGFVNRWGGVTMAAPLLIAFAIGAALYLAGIHRFPYDDTSELHEQGKSHRDHRARVIGYAAPFLVIAGLAGCLWILNQNAATALQQAKAFILMANVCFLLLMYHVLTTCRIMYHLAQRGHTGSHKKTRDMLRTSEFVCRKSGPILAAVALMAAVIMVVFMYAAPSSIYVLKWAYIHAIVTIGAIILTPLTVSGFALSLKPMVRHEYQKARLLSLLSPQHRGTLIESLPLSPP
ncbi:MAG: hypothetical protein D8M59_13770 [Planctomycetes bacterium]|nr:hypothetical protein [Planctomycetota bacterium]NOG55576.1 hypothetical protein [Planctomycetota bacterium]